MTKKYATLGAISTNTLKEEDLIPIFAFELACLVKNDYDQSVNGILDEAGKPEPADWILDELTEQLNDHAPPYCYFGAHPGDAACFGFWLSNDALDNFDGLRVGDLSQVPETFTGEVLLVNDHGNTTLYSAQNGDLTEIWSVV